MNEFFGMTYERLQEIQDQIRAIGKSLEPLKEQVRERFDQEAADASARQAEADAQLIAAGGLLSRLEQSLFETDFWIQGVRSYMDAEALDIETCGRISAVVIDAYGGFRDVDDPYGAGGQELILQQMVGDLGLGDLSGGIVMIAARKAEAPAPDPAA